MLLGYLLKENVNEYSKSIGLRNIFRNFLWENNKAINFLWQFFYISLESDVKKKLMQLLWKI